MVIAAIIELYLLSIDAGTEYVVIVMGIIGVLAGIPLPQDLLGGLFGKK
jgi:hypothetical protein